MEKISQEKSHKKDEKYLDRIDQVKENLEKQMQPVNEILSQLTMIKEKYIEVDKNEMKRIHKEAQSIVDRLKLEKKDVKRERTVSTEKVQKMETEYKKLISDKEKVKRGNKQLVLDNGKLKAQNFELLKVIQRMLDIQEQEEAYKCLLIEKEKNLKLITQIQNQGKQEIQEESKSEQQIDSSSKKEKKEKSVKKLKKENDELKQKIKELQQDYQALKSILYPQDSCEKEDQGQQIEVDIKQKKQIQKILKSQPELSVESVCFLKWIEQGPLDIDEIISNSVIQTRFDSSQYSVKNFKLQNGDTCVGQIDKITRKKHGIIRYQWKDNQLYEGQYQEDRLCGYGRFFDKNGGLYIGQWKDDKRNGFGIQFNSDGSVKHQGDWINNKPKLSTEQTNAK